MKRRHFLKNMAAGGIAPYFMGGLPLSAFGQLNETALGDDKVLVVIQMAGGNDGLNTLIPVDQYSRYQSARKNIAIPENKLLSIPQSDKIGIHPSLEKITQLFEEGKGTIIQDVGYPDPDFSHFRSTDIWNTASDSDKHVLSGWAGRYLSIENPDYPNGYPNTNHPDPLSIQIGSVLNTSLQGPVYPMGMAIADPNFFYELIAETPVATTSTYAEKELAFLKQVANQTNQYSGVIRDAGQRITNQSGYPDESLANQLKIVAKLIAGGLRTKFYFVQIGGFDTHDNQVQNGDVTKGEHAELLQKLSEAVFAFTRDLEKQGISERVLTMTYSEFGRRIRSNASLGTDHGAAAPMFLFGSHVNSKVFGENPILPDNPQTEDNVPMQYDFRSVYASVLERWFCLDTGSVSDVMLKPFQSLPLIQGGPCGFITANEPQPEILFKAYPNPFEDFLTIEFESKGGYNYVQVFNSRGQQIGSPVSADYPKGLQNAVLKTSRWPKGMYFLRWQNALEQKVIRIIKI
ncbi:DUF1501 domain-containing protein [Jiulongibacter sediminis]|uniref:Secretion system C-terminal sorting domain-containing protein n=1 Tax=Jiulongibacter sediminis TaxID=1605367 RepID=A0A0P7C4Y2_9BACT|nr:DUF1501 domain-containing protein [Jiulongibacter sediminis]KPM47050.1 hypothetical protein AFM12_17665 [Jiulongibacter sediminis]TBX22393.1 hypothetical protein TK44_17670 [Jiulongibacter sediminis]